MNTFLHMIISGARRSRSAALFSLTGLLTAATLSASQFDVSVAIGSNPADGSVIVARGGNHSEITLLRGPNSEPAWTNEGPSEPSAVIFSEDGRHAAVLDAFHDKAYLISTSRGVTRAVDTGSTPVAALFHGEDLFILCRDANVLMRLSPGGSVRLLPVDPDSIFLRSSDGRLYVYSRRGSIIEADPDSMSVVRSAQSAPAASDFEVHGKSAWLVVPSTGEIIALSLEDLTETERLRPAAAPTDLALQDSGGVLKGGTIAVADPASKRVWRGETSQSELAAFGRGFLRGLLGLGLYKPRSNEYPAGVDRIWAARWGIAAHDGSSGTLYVLGSGKATAIASGIPAAAIAVTPDGVLFWSTDTETVAFHAVKDRTGY